jgi:hypothetical protein
MIIHALFFGCIQKRLENGINETYHWKKHKQMQLKRTCQEYRDQEEIDSPGVSCNICSTQAKLSKT